jgi:hypothetical protein
MNGAWCRFFVPGATNPCIAAQLGVCTDAVMFHVAIIVQVKTAS